MAVESAPSHPLQDIAPAGFARWKIPLAALLVHLSIGQVYSFSIFNKPLARLLGVTAPAAGDWDMELLGWIFSLAIGTLGLTAAFAGPTLEKWGPRKTIALAALFFSCGFGVGALGIYLHNFWLLLGGYGVLGGVGLGLGYATPVSVLMRWFPDKPGLAAGMAIMGFGGGAMIAAPLAVKLMALFATPTQVGVWQTFVVMGLIYACAMALGAFLIHNPSAAFLKSLAPAQEAPATKAPAPKGQKGKAQAKAQHAKAQSAKAKGPSKVIKEAEHTTGTTDTTPNGALQTVSFYLLWGLFFLNIQAGLSVISSAASMVQELFPAASLTMAATFVTLLSVGNMLGRLLWATASDYLGRRTTFSVFFVLGAALYSALPLVGTGSVWVYMGLNILLISMYGGGFSTLPAYIKECFGMKHLGAIYGRLLTAWSAGAVLGHMLIAELTAFQLAHGYTRLQAWQNTMYITADLLLLALVLNLLVKTRKA
jgi:MFS family permease